LHALQAAALLLPGLVPTPVAAQQETDPLSFQYSHYEEGSRSLYTARSNLAPLHADTLRLSGSHALGDTQALRFAVSQDTWSGATPVSTAPLAAAPNRAILRDGPNGVVVSGASPYLDASLPVAPDGTPLRQEPGSTLVADPRAVLVLSSASPEVRQQADLALSSQIAGFDGRLGLSYSTERDYLARGLNAALARDFNQQLTTLSLGMSYSDGRIDALLDPDALPYLDRSAWRERLIREPGTERFSASRHDGRVELGLTQVLDARSYLEVALGYARGSGYLGNPYKAVSVLFAPPEPGGAIRHGELHALLEQRPGTQHQTQLNLHYAHALPYKDGALHADYAYSSDSWNIRSHSIELRWVQPMGAWRFTPHVRWYRQSEAGFYTTWLTMDQAWRGIATDAQGRQIWTPVNQSEQYYYRSAAGDFLDADGRPVDATQLDLQPLQRSYDRALLPTYFSSDHRLASFGSINGGVTLSRHFANGVVFEAGLDLYRRSGAWGLGNGENNDFADFRFTQFNLGLQLDFGERGQPALNPAAMNHAEHATHALPPLPAGLRLVQAMHAPGTLSFGYQTQYARQGGSLGAADVAVVTQGCGAQGCRYAPRMMTMQMHMLMLDYQWRENLSLMLMPQYMSMEMGLRELAGSPPARPGEHLHGAGEHQSGSIGDTVLAATWQPSSLSKLQITLGFSVPTGKVDLDYRRQNHSDGGLMHFDMQTGSGTWDLLPALTWQDGIAAWRYGAQLSGVKRVEARNDSSYRLGDQWQLSTWATHPLTAWLAGSARLTHTWRDAVQGDFTQYNARLGPMDFPANQGGRYTDLGLGLSVALPASQQLAVEWEAPVQDDPTGFQLEREGQWNLRWHVSW
jgi:hypothetical protein